MRRDDKKAEAVSLLQTCAQNGGRAWEEWRRENLNFSDLEGVDLKRIHLPNIDLTGMRLTGADLAGALLCGAQLAGADLTKAVLTGAILVGAGMRFTNLRGANLARADLSGSDLTLCLSINEARFPNAQLRGARFQGLDARNGNFRRADLRGASFIAADLRGADFTYANLRGANFRYASTGQAMFSSAPFGGTGSREHQDLVYVPDASAEDVRLLAWKRVGNYSYDSRYLPWDFHSYDKGWDEDGEWVEERVPLPAGRGRVFEHQAQKVPGAGGLMKGQRGYKQNDYGIVYAFNPEFVGHAGAFLTWVGRTSPQGKHVSVIHPNHWYEDDGAYSPNYSSVGGANGFDLHSFIDDEWRPEDDWTLHAFRPLP
ncbi:pentapeptide repeat-containing protein [Patescibacteria group bacterium]|nr:pentapeptide repeat-containing protein [Patescibacteria group bacterium]